VWAEKEWVYIEAMMEVTPVRDPECFARMENLASKGGKASRLRALRLFLEQLVQRGESR
jgi:hypothetical protein